ncbi:MAG: hypothetical protein GWO22_34390, partial [Actinobacteria bacterium]|nr:hypothetical protein [Actinomycetota bacterium]
MTDPVPRLATVRHNLPSHVAAAIERALAKAPADRHPTVDAWRSALKQPDTATGTTGTPPAFLKHPPAPATPLIGREDQLDAATGRLTDGARVLTLTG